MSERCQCCCQSQVKSSPAKPDAKAAETKWVAMSGLVWASVGRGSGSARHTSGLEAPLQAKGYGG